MKSTVGPSAGPALRQLAAVALATVMVIPAVAVFVGGSETMADTTTAVQPDGKYGRFYVTYVPHPGFTEVNVANVSGSIGGVYPNSGYKYWQRYIASLWRQDPATGIWYNLLNTTPGAWWQHSTLSPQDYTFGTYYVSDWANVQMRNRYIVLDGQPGFYHCSTVVDFQFWGYGQGIAIFFSGTFGPC